MVCESVLCAWVYEIVTSASWPPRKCHHMYETNAARAAITHRLMTTHFVTPEAPPPLPSQGEQPASDLTYPSTQDPHTTPVYPV